MMDFNDDNMAVNDEINEAIKQELESWDLFGNALKNDDKTLFHNMKSDLKDYYKFMRDQRRADDNRSSGQNRLKVT
jgi:hypothetical protein